MADEIKISELPAVTIPAGTDTFPVVQGGVTKKETVSQALTSAGSVIGPASATDNAITRFDGTTGKLIQNSNATIDDSGNLTAANFSGSSSGSNTGDVTVLDTGNVDLSLIGQQISGAVINGAFSPVSANDNTNHVLTDGVGFNADYTGGITSFTLVGALALKGQTCAIFGGDSSGWTLTIPAGKTLMIGALTYTNISISSNSADDCLFVRCVKADAVYEGYSTNTAALLDAGFNPTNYTPVNGTVKGNLQGIDTKIGTLTAVDFEWEEKIAPGTYTLSPNTGFIANTGGSFEASLPVTASVDEYYAVCIGVSSPNALVIHPGQTVNFGSESVSNGSMIDLGMVLHASNTFFLVCTQANTVFNLYSSNTARFISSFYTPAHYTATNDNVSGSLEGIDDALTNVATIYRDVYVDVGRGIDGSGGNGSQLYPYKTPAYAMSQITPTTTNRYNIIIQSGTYDGADGTFALKPFTTITCESSLTTRFTNSEITLDSSWLNTDSDVSLTNLNVESGTGINFDSTTFGTATINITISGLRSAADISYSGRDPGKDVLFFFPTNVSGNIAIDSILFFCFSGYITGGVTGAATVGDSQIIYDGTILTTTTTVQSTTFTATLSLASGVSVGLVTADGSAAVLNLGAGMALFAGYSAINGATVNVITPASTVNGDFTPTNYTPVDTSVKGHLQGVDAKVATTVNAVMIGPATATSAFSSSNLTLTNGQLLIGSTAASPVATTLTAGDNISIVNAAGSITISSSAGDDLTWQTLTGSPGATTLVNNTGYICNTGIQAEFVLPTTATIDFISAIRGGTSPYPFLFKNLSGKNIQVGTQNTGIGADSAIEGTDPSDGINIGCTQADTNFYVDRIQGNVSIFSEMAPSDLSGLIAWYKADDVNDGGAQPADDDALSSWLDLSGNSFDLVQATGSNQPIFKEFVFNGLPGVLFDGINDYMLNSTMANTTNKFYLFFVATEVAFLTVCHGWVSVYRSGSSTDWNDTGSVATSECTQGSMDSTRPSQGTLVTPPIINDKPFIYSIVNDGSLWYAAASPYTTNTIGAGSNFNQDRIVVGSRYDTGYGGAGFGGFLNGYMHEIIIGNGTLTQYSQKMIMSYLSNKWGVPL